jgi:hypothetical protein
MTGLGPSLCAFTQKIFLRVLRAFVVKFPFLLRLRLRRARLFLHLELESHVGNFVGFDFDLLGRLT